MRWNKKDPNFQAGDTRITKKFLFWPMRAGQELRWLEFATFEESAYIEDVYWLTGHYTTQSWKPIRFVD